MALAAADAEALERLAEASPEQLREAVARMPSDQRGAFHWLARELDLLARAPAVDPGGLLPEAPGPLSLNDRRRAHALLERARLEREISSSAATPAQKAFMQQTLAHLWSRLQAALPESARPAGGMVGGKGG